LRLFADLGSGAFGAVRWSLPPQIHRSVFPRPQRLPAADASFRAEICTRFEDVYEVARSTRDLVALGLTGRSRIPRAASLTR